MQPKNGRCFDRLNRPPIGSGTRFAPGRARTCNPVIRSHKVDSEQAGKTDDSFCLNGEFQVDIAPVDVVA